MMRSHDKIFRQMIRRRAKWVGIVKMPAVGLCDVYIEDGRALLLPGFGGVVIVDWFVFMRHVRRHGQRHLIGRVA